MEAKVKKLSINWLKISLLSIVVVSALTVSVKTHAQDEDIDTTEDEEQLIPQSTTAPTQQPLIIDDGDSSEASEVEYEE